MKKFLNRIRTMPDGQPSNKNDDDEVGLNDSPFHSKQELEVEQANSRASTPKEATRKEPTGRSFFREETFLHLMTDPVGIFCIDEDGTENIIAAVTLKDLERVKVLGKGFQGEVHLVKHKYSNLFLAEKEQKTGKASVRDQLREEIRLVSGFRHRNLVQTYGSLYNEENQTVHSIMELCDLGCMYSSIYVMGSIPEPVLSWITRHSLLGLQELHSKNVLHRDIKTQNILLSSTNNTAALTDFGFSKNKDIANTFCGTIEYMSPERLNGVGYTKAADVFSIGLCVLEGHLGKHPFEDRNLYWDYVTETAENKEKKMFENFKDDASDDLKAFVHLCTEGNPSDRGTCEQLLNHQWITKFDNDKQVFFDWLSDLKEKKQQKKPTEK